MKVKYLLAMIALLVLASCHHKTNSEMSGNDSIVDISEISITDTTIIDDEEKIIHAKMMYYDFDKIDNLESFFDSIFLITESISVEVVIPYFEAICLTEAPD